VVILFDGEDRRVEVIFNLTTAVFVKVLAVRNTLKPTSANPETSKCDGFRAADGGIILWILMHEMGFARKVADRFIFIDKGRIVEGTPVQVFGSP